MNKKPLLMASIFAALLSIQCFNSSASIQEGVAAYHNSDYQRANELLEAEVSSTQPSDKLYHYLGRTAYLQGRLDKAEFYFKEAIKLNDHQSEHFYWLAVTYAAQFSEVSFFSAGSLADRFLEAANKAVELDPNSLPAHEGLLKFYIGAPGIVGGSISKAKLRAKLIAELDSAAGSLALGRLHLYEEEYNEAESYCRKALKTNPDNVEYNYALGMLLRESERHAEAVEIFTHTASLKASGAFARIQVWGALYQAGRAAAISGEQLEQGQQAIERYLQRNVNHPDLPGNDWAEFRLAIIYQHQGNIKQAKKLIKRLLAGDPEGDLRRKLKKALKRLKRKS